MSTVSRDTIRETATPLTDGCNKYKNNRMVRLKPFFIRLTLTVSVSVLQDVVKVKHHRLCWKCNCSYVLTAEYRLTNKSSNFYKIPLAINKIMLNILSLCFFVDTV